MLGVIIEYSSNIATNKVNYSNFLKSICKTMYITKFVYSIIIFVFYKLIFKIKIHMTVLLFKILTIFNITKYSLENNINYKTKFSRKSL